VRPVVALIAVAAIIPQYVLLAAGSHLRNSQAAFNAGDAAKVRSEALAAKALEPWAASPYLQLGLLAEAQGNLRGAAHWLDEAIQRSQRDYSLWLTAARIEVKRGDAHAAKRDLAEARRLNPNSTAFTGKG
jgi:tetratricopeptide (TPR) repeat protein